MSTSIPRASAQPTMMPPCPSDTGDSSIPAEEIEPAGTPASPHTLAPEAFQHCTKIASWPLLESVHAASAPPAPALTIPGEFCSAVLVDAATPDGLQSSAPSGPRRCA